MGLQGAEEGRTVGAVGPPKSPSMLMWGRTSSWPARWRSATAPPSGMAPFCGGDLNKITVGFCSNVQERCVVHAAWSSPTGLPAETSIERYVTIGAYSLLRSCTIEPECIIGQRSILMEGSLVETHSILEAGSVVAPGRRIPIGELWAGNPAKFVRALTHEETLEIPKLAVAIHDLSRSYLSEFLPCMIVLFSNRNKQTGRLMQAHRLLSLLDNSLPIYDARLQ